MSDLTVDKSVLEQLRERGGAWAVYRNEDLGHPMLGHLQFLKFGPECTYTRVTLPAQAPDSTSGLGWRYRFCGVVDLPSGEILPRALDEVRSPAPPST